MNTDKLRQALVLALEALDEDATPAEAPKAQPAKTPRRRARSFPAPLRPVSDAAKERAKKMIDRRGAG